MFGIVRPCSHHLPAGQFAAWTAHLCGLCLALRGDHGQFARVVTNYDGLLVSVLTEAQAAAGAAERRTAGPCPLRGMRTASVAKGEGARLAASVSLVLASAKVRDHIADGDGALRRRPVAAAARRVAARWDRSGADSGEAVGFDTGVLVAAVDRQQDIELAAGPGTPLTVITEPTEAATAAAFAHTARIAGRPGNAAPLAEAGRLFGRLAHLLDAVEDRTADAASGAWNPLAATGATLTEARELCDDAVRGIRLALADVEFTDGTLAHTLLVHEVRRAVDRAFGSRCAHGAHGAHGARPSGTADSGDASAPYAQNPHAQNPHVQQPYAQNPYGPGNPYTQNPNTQQPYGQDPYGQAPYGQAPPGLNGPQAPHPVAPYGPGGPGGPGDPGDGGDGSGGGPGGPGGRRPRRPRGLIAGCAAALAVCCTCQVCCASSYESPWSREQREGCCHKCDCCDCCEGGCECCDCGGCDCGCDC